MVAEDGLQLESKALGDGVAVGFTYYVTIVIMRIGGYYGIFWLPWREL